jgi:hypothetical protein
MKKYLAVREGSQLGGLFSGLQDRKVMYSTDTTLYPTCQRSMCALYKAFLPEHSVTLSPPEVMPGVLGNQTAIVFNNRKEKKLFLLHKHYIVGLTE